MNIIAILDKEHKITALLEIVDGVISVEYLDSEIKKELDPVLDIIQTKDLSIRREIFDDEGTSLVAKTVASTDPNYPEAVVDELKSRRFRALLVDTGFKPYLVSFNDISLTDEQRRQFFVALVTTSPQDQKELLTTLTTLQPTLDKLKQNREEWNKALQQKTDEILKNKDL